MRLRDGLQTCQNCGGQGCYWCRRTGQRAQCPVCMNSEPELIHQEDEDLTCLACGSVFSPDGGIVDREIEIKKTASSINREPNKT